jgi:hypothetical protein
VEGLFADAFLTAHFHNGLSDLLGFPQNADLLFCRIPFRFHLSGSFLWAQTNFSSGTVQVISTRVMKKLEIESVAELVRFCQKAGIEPVKIKDPDLI